jgi:hypothetical protein
MTRAPPSSIVSCGAFENALYSERNAVEAALMRAAGGVAKY